MANDLNNFDRLIKNSFEGYEADYNPLHWEELEEELQVVAPGLSSYFGAITTGIVITSIVFMGMLFFYSDGGQGTNSVAEQEALTEETGGTSGAEESTMHSTNSESDNTAAYAASEAEDKNFQSEDSESAQTESNTEDLIAEIKSGESNLNNSNSNERTNESGSKIKDGKIVTEESSEAISKSKVRTGCTGMTIRFNAADEYGTDAKYLWNFGDGFFSTDANPSHTFNKEGIFDVSLSVTSHSTGQITSNVVQAMIEVVEAPIAGLEVDIETGSAITFKNKSYNSSEIEWKLDDEIVSAKPEINLSIADNTQYNMALVAYNEGGCTDTLKALVNSINAGSEFPRAFETSYGALFAPGAIIDDGEVKSVKIFEKISGKLVFEASGSKGWDGKLPDGKEAKNGAYQWIMAVAKKDSYDIYHGDLELR